MAHNCKETINDYLKFRLLKSQNWLWRIFKMIYKNFICFFECLQKNKLFVKKIFLKHPKVLLRSRSSINHELVLKILKLCTKTFWKSYIIVFNSWNPFEFSFIIDTGFLFAQIVLKKHQLFLNLIFRIRNFIFLKVVKLSPVVQKQELRSQITVQCLNVQQNLVVFVELIHEIFFI